MVQRLKASLVVGTRPEAIKIAPIVLAMNAASDRFEPQLVSTGQHRAMLDRAFGDLGISPERDLNVMRDRQTLPELTSRVMLGVSELLETERPDLLVVQGDTTVRRHINWNNLRPDLKEDLDHLVQDIRRRVCGIAIAVSPSF